MRDIEKRSGAQLHNHRKILRDFFIEVLGIDYRVAEDGASKMEHAVSGDITERMVQYASCLKKKTIKQQSERKGSL